MKKRFIYIALFSLAMTACTEQEIIEQPSTPTGGTEIRLPADVTSGELLIKFKPEMTDILDQTMTRAAKSSGVMTRSGIPSTDEVLDILGDIFLAGPVRGHIIAVKSSHALNTALARQIAGRAR